MMAEEEIRPEKLIKIGVIGNVDAGKSTLVSVLTKGIADDGNGAARVRVFNYIHEQTTGRTSSIGQEIMGFSREGKQILPERFNQNKNKYWKEVVSQSYKIAALVDLCGHEKYLKTTINGLTGLTPDFGCVVIGANMGIQKMTKEHIGLCLFLKIPFFIILTKVDLAPQNKYQETMDELKRLLRHKLLNKFPIEITDKTAENEQIKVAELMPKGNVCPIFPISNVSKTGFDNLTKFIWRIERQNPITLEEVMTQPCVFEINENFTVEGVGLVVSGVVKSGVVGLNKTYLLGPDKNKNFKSVAIKSIHINRVQRDEAYAGELACLCLKATKANEKLVRKDIRRGMVVVDHQEKPEPALDFEAEIQVLHNSTTMKIKYEGVLHCGTIQQTVTLNEIYGGEELLRNEDRALVKLSFKYRPEFVREGETFLLREGKTKVIGTITKILG
jgi:GTPase